MLAAIRLVKQLFLPPAGPLALAAGGLALSLWLPRAGTALAAAGVGLLWLLSLPAVGARLLGLLARHPPLPAAGELPAADALVILDGGRQPGAAEYGGDDLRLYTQERLRYGAFLHRRLPLPVLVSGNGHPRRMAELLEEGFGVGVRWIEPASRNTWENARASAALLRPAGVRRIYLVTHFWHMPRAAAAFRRAGLTVLPAPMGFAAVPRGPAAWLPHPEALTASRLACHEWVGAVWYRLRYHRISDSTST